jgi:hypothetical protein
MRLLKLFGPVFFVIRLCLPCPSLSEYSALDMRGLGRWTWEIRRGRSYLAAVGALRSACDLRRVNEEKSVLRFLSPPPRYVPPLLRRFRREITSFTNQLLQSLVLCHFFCYLLIILQWNLHV